MRGEGTETCNSGLRADIISSSLSVGTEVNCLLGRTKSKTRHELIASEQIKLKTYISISSLLIYDIYHG